MIIKAPNNYDLGKVSVFLAGSIEMGKAENWQKALGEELEALYGDKIVILDPRRDDWDSTWTQEDKEGSAFREQVDWEQKALNHADVQFFYFSPGTISPITLLELGQHIGTSDVVVCCPEGYFRKGNVDVVCRHADTLNHPSIEAAKHALIAKIDYYLDRQERSKELDKLG